MNDKKEKAKQKMAENLIAGKSINLIPPLTEHEAHIEKRKVSVNTNAAFALLFFFVLSLSIVGFNLFSKLDLNQRKEELYALEQSIRAREEVISSNDEILRRVKLYNSIEQSTYSSKDVINYWQGVSKGIATINQIDLTQGMTFEVTGTAKTLTDVSKLWYLLGNDAKVETLDLRSVAKDKTLVRFEFEGKLNFNEFAKNAGS